MMLLPLRDVSLPTARRLCCCCLPRGSEYSNRRLRLLRRDMAAAARWTLSMLLRIYSSLGSRPSLFDRRWVCGFGRSGKLGRCRALLAQRTRLGACRRLPMLFRFELCSYDSAFVGCSAGTRRHSSIPSR